MHRNIKARKSVSKLNSESTKDSKDESLTNDLFEAKGSPLRGMRIYKSYIFFYTAMTTFNITIYDNSHLQMT